MVGLALFWLGVGVFCFVLEAVALTVLGPRASGKGEGEREGEEERERERARESEGERERGGEREREREGEREGESKKRGRGREMEGVRKGDCERVGIESNKNCEFPFFAWASDEQL